MDQQLALGNEFAPGLNEVEAQELKNLQQVFVESYIKNKENMKLEEWLQMELAKQLPEKEKQEIVEISNEIIDTLNTNENSRKSIDEAVANGRSKESWFASTVKKATSHMSMQESVKYLHELDEALKTANDSMRRVITTKSGLLNQNMNLDGFIAEQHHVNSFNLEAKLKGSKYRAEVLVPKDGQTYGKNSVDIVIRDKNGKIVRRYQSKYCADPESTVKALNDGDYRGQRKLVGEGQAKDVKKATEIIESPDGIKSKPLSKKRAKDLQKEAQSGKWNDANWNEYKTKDLAIGIGKQAGMAAVQGAAIGAGMDVASKLWKGEEIKGKEVVETALKTGTDFGVKAAVAGALKVGVEKGVIKFIPKGTPASTLANIAYVGIENTKIAWKVMKKELAIQEGLDQMEVVTVSTVAGIAGSAKGTLIGMKVGTVFGPPGVAFGALIGGTVGYMAGSKVGEVVTKGLHKVRDYAREVVKDLAEKVYSGAKTVVNNVKDMVSSLIPW